MFVKQLHFFGLTCGALQSNNIYFVSLAPVRRKDKIKEYDFLEEPKLFGFACDISKAKFLSTGPDDESADETYGHLVSIDPRRDNPTELMIFSVRLHPLFKVTCSCERYVSQSSLFVSWLINFSFTLVLCSPGNSLTRDWHLGKGFTTQRIQITGDCFQ